MEAESNNGNIFFITNHHNEFGINRGLDWYLYVAYGLLVVSLFLISGIFYQLENYYSS